MGKIKLNCDAAWSAKSKLGGIGIIARDHEGRLKGGWHGTIRAASTEEVEARAVLEGVRLAVSMEWQNVILESDALTVINQLQCRDLAWRLASTLANATSLEGSLERIYWVHIPSSANACADWIAKQSLLGLCHLD